MKRALLALALATSTAHAETDADKLAAQGEELAKTGEYTRAIDAFKAADKLQVRARHACMIGLAYLRRELWPQAELFFDTCKARASMSDPLPDWFQDAMSQLREKLAGTAVSAVTIRVNPEGSLAQVTASSFAPDEKFSPRTIHLTPGQHTIVVEAPGYPSYSHTFTVRASGEQLVEITLRHAEKRYVTPPASKVPFAIIGGGLAAVLVGAGYHIGAYAPLRSDLTEAMTPDDYNALRPKVSSRRTTTLALYGVGAAAIATGFILRATVFARSSVLVGAEATDGGGMITLGWQR
jgi:hypothetical protein